MPVTVTPPTFSLVGFDAERIRELAERAVTDVGLPASEDVRIEVDESTFFGRTFVLSVEPVHVKVESGGFEDPKRPKQQSDDAVLDVLGAVLHRVVDRRGPGFAGAPPDDELTLQQLTAWQAYAVGRSNRLGYPVSQSRWRYHFRNRHGFTDTADKVFDRLWSGESLTWADIQDACDETAAAREGAPA